MYDVTNATSAQEFVKDLHLMNKNQLDKIQDLVDMMIQLDFEDFHIFQGAKP
jgi:hypothetical protein